MVEIIRIGVAIFFCFGALDMFWNNRIGVGESFANGIRTMGGLAMGMIGIYSLSPILGNWLMQAFTPLSNWLGIDISVFPSIFLAVDMGAYLISSQIAQNEEIGRFAGIIIGSTFGTALSFSFPVAIAVVRPEDRAVLLKSFVIGILTIPPGCLAAGFVQGLAVGALFKSVLPIAVLSLLLAVILLIREQIIITVLSLFYKVILLIGLIGIALQGLHSIAGIKLVDAMVPLSEAALVVVQIAFFLGGVYPVIHILQRVLKRPLYRLEMKTGIDNLSLICVLGTFVTNIMVFDLFKDLHEKGKLLCGILAFCAAFVIGGQLAYIAAVEQGMVIPFFTAKLVSGGIGLAIFCFYQKAIDKKIKIMHNNFNI